MSKSSLQPNQSIYGLDVTPSTLIDRLFELSTLPIPETAFVWGAMGIGKSQIAEQLAKRMGLPHVIWNMSTWEPQDAIGLPYPKFCEERGHEVTRWIPPDVMPRHQSVIIIEEMNACRPEMQVTMYHLLLERRLGVVEVPKGSMIVALGNRDEDKGATVPLPKPLSDRCWHFHLKPSVKDWATWAGAHNIDPEDVAFIMFKGDDTLHNVPVDGHAFPTPRSWTKLFNTCKAIGAGSSQRFDLATAKVGCAAAIEYQAFRSQTDQLITFEEIVAAPDKAQIPKEVGMKYAVTCMLGSRAEAGNVDKIIPYVKRIGSDFTVIWANEASKKPGVINNRAYMNWAATQVQTKIAVGG